MKQKRKILQVKTTTTTKKNIFTKPRKSIKLLYSKTNSYKNVLVEFKKKRRRRRNFYKKKCFFFETKLNGRFLIFVVHLWSRKYINKIIKLKRIKKKTQTKSYGIIEDENHIKINI